MFKKVLSLALAAMLLLSVGVVGAFAAETDVETTAASGKVYFEVPADWKNFTTIFCHIWEVEGESFYSWQAKKEKCKDEGNGKWSYDLSTLDGSTTVTGGMQSGKSYAIIFSNNNGLQTYDLNMGPDCAGDTVYTGETLRNPVDSEKTCLVARWRANGSKYHPVVQYDSLGDLFDPDNTGAEVQQSQAAEEDPSKAAENGGSSNGGSSNGGSSNGGSSNGGSSNGGSSNGGSSNGGSSNGGSSNGGGSSTGTSNSVNSGEGTAVIFIAIGTMLAAAAIVFAARKREN